MAVKAKVVDEAMPSIGAIWNRPGVGGWLMMTDMEAMMRLDWDGMLPTSAKVTVDPTGREFSAMVR